MRTWEPRRWLVAGLGGLAVGLMVAVPTAVIPTPLFGREIAVTWWSYPTVLASAVLGGLLVATYIRRAGPALEPEELDGASKAGLLGGLVAFFAVGCPVCNKLVLLALGASGAVTWFAPIQPLLALGSVVLLAVALRSRLGGEVACPSGVPIANHPADR